MLIVENVKYKRNGNVYDDSVYVHCVGVASSSSYKFIKYHDHTNGKCKSAHIHTYIHIECALCVTVTGKLAKNYADSLG